MIFKIMCLARELYSLCKQVKGNKKKSQRLAQRVEVLKELVCRIKQEDAEKVKTALGELEITLESAIEVVKKYTFENWFWYVAMAYNYGDKFQSMNDRISDAFEKISMALLVDHSHKLNERTSRMAEDEADRKEDDEELQKMLQRIMENQDARAVKLDAMAEKQDAMAADIACIIEMLALHPTLIGDIKKLHETLQKPKLNLQDIREIKYEELVFDIPKKPLMKTDISEVYKGQYKKMIVAIKRYTNTGNIKPSDVRMIFEKEIQNMKQCDSKNILRMFGICIQDENGPNQNLFVVMEFCKNGRLREVLDSKRELPWDRKVRMCLDAALGIYCLHQSEEKSTKKILVHGSIDSHNFLVDEDFRVKLAGLDLAKTETSMRRNVKLEDPKKSPLRYGSPEQLENVNHPYCKICEIYSLGMVLWEIATRKKPLDDCTTDTEVYKRVCEEKQLLEPLPDDCPEQLGQLINACRAYDAFQRPTAGALVDELRKVVEQLEEKSGETLLKQ